MVLPALSLEYRPVDQAANANTDETTMNAINTMGGFQASGAPLGAPQVDALYRRFEKQNRD